MVDPHLAELALAHVRVQAARTRPRDIARIRRVLDSAGIAAGIDELCAGLGRSGAVTINFHPDRVAADGRTVAEALAAGGIYRNQFETRISSGGLTAYPGGERDTWESSLFGGVYQSPGVDASERPRYGGLDFLDLANGACPRFGSCHLRLRPDVLRRSTFFVGDSVTQPSDGGVIDRLEAVLAGLLESVSRGEDMGRPVTLAALVARLLADLPGEPPAMSHALDYYVEVQVHGPVDLRTDVEAVAIDPSFDGTPAGDALLDAAGRYGLDARWHTGSQLTADEMPREEPLGTEPRRWREFCRGGRAADFARWAVERHSADGRYLNAAVLGRAAASVITDPDWQSWHDAEDPLTRLKDLWHILVVFGHP